MQRIVQLATGPEPDWERHENVDDVGLKSLSER